jgi:linoleate 10R-lipoxygenase
MRTISQPDVFKNPEVIDPTRPREDYSSFGRDAHTCLGAMFTEQVRTI